MAERSRMPVLLRHFLRSPQALISSIVLLLLVIGAVFAGVIAPQNPYHLQNLSLANAFLPPSWLPGGHAGFVLGTDNQGRDIFSTILYGSRTSFEVGFGVVLLAGLIGGTIGLLAGFFGGWLDVVTMRVADTLLSFSTTLIAMLMLGLFKHSSVLLVVLAIVVADWVQYARTIRGSVLQVKQEDYVTAGRALGGRSSRIVLRHVLPNAIPPLFVIAAVDFGVAVLLEATLSFLGVGVPITEPSLGSMIAQGKNFMYAGDWWMVVFPAVVLMALVFSLNLLADWLRTELDPRGRGRT